MANNHSTLPLVLASTSKYRRSLLDRLGLPFTCEAPNVDERSYQETEPAKLAETLAIAKAEAVAQTQDKALIIGSDQVAWLEDQQLHKPETRQRNIDQLQMCSGKSVYFYTGLALVNTETGKTQSCVEVYETKFRAINLDQITHYVDQEKAFDCAGGFKMEGLGISLFESIRGDDPNSLIGLPLIQLIKLLQNENIDVLS